MLFSGPAQPVLRRGGPQGPGGAGAVLCEKGGGGGREAGLRDGAGACQGWFSGETSGKVQGSRQAREGRTGASERVPGRVRLRAAEPGLGSVRVTQGEAEP